MELLIEIPVRAIPADERVKIESGEAVEIGEEIQLRRGDTVHMRGPSETEIMVLVLSFPVTVAATTVATILCRYIDRMIGGPAKVEGLENDGRSEQALEESILMLAEYIKTKRETLGLTDTTRAENK